MDQNFNNYPCQLHLDRRLNIELLKKYGVKIRSTKDDLVESRDTLEDDFRPETLVGMACETCWKAGRLVHSDLLQTVARGDFLGYRAQLPGKKGKWVELNGEEPSFHGNHTYSTVGFYKRDGSILKALRFILLKNDLTAAGLSLAPRVTLLSTGQILYDQSRRDTQEQDDSADEAIPGLLDHILSNESGNGLEAFTTQEQPAPTANMICKPADGGGPSRMSKCFAPLGGSSRPGSASLSNSASENFPLSPSATEKAHSDGRARTTESPRTHRGTTAESHNTVTEDEPPRQFLQAPAGADERRQPTSAQDVVAAIAAKEARIAALKQQVQRRVQERQSQLNSLEAEEADLIAQLAVLEDR